MAETVKGINIVFGAETVEFDRSVKGVNQALKLVGAEARKINSELKLDPKNVDLMKQRFDKLGKSLDLTKHKLQIQQEELAKISKKDIGGDAWKKQIADIEKTNAQIVSLEAEMKRLNARIKQVGMGAESFKKLSRSLSKVGDQFERIGQKMMIVTGAIAGAMYKTVDAAIDFESAFAGVRKTVDATEAEFQEMSDGIRQMAREIPASVEEISAVAEAAGQLGIEKENILDFTRTMIDLGEATNLSAEQGATELSRFANITGMSQADFGRLGSTIVALGNNFATTESDISSMALRLAGSGAQAGLSESDILALSAALSSVGIEAEAGGSSFSKLMSKMQLAVETGNKDLTGFAKVAGVSTKQFKKAWEKDATGAILMFIDGLGKAEQNGQSAIKVLDDMGITEVRLRDALLRASGASDIFSEAVRVGSSAWEENTALTKEAEERYKTLKSQIDIAKNALNDIAIEIGQFLTPYVAELAGKLQELSNWFGQLETDQQRLVLQIAGVVGAIGPVLMIIGKLFKIGSGVSGMIATLSGKLGIAAGALGGIIGIAAAVVAGFIALYTGSEEFRNSIDNLLGVIGDFLLPIFSRLWDFFQKRLIPIFKRIIDIAGKIFAPLVDFITTFLSPILEGLNNLFEQVLVPTLEFFADIIETVVLPIVETLADAFETVVGWVSDAVDGLMEFLGLNKEAKGVSVAGVGKKISEAAGGAYQSVTQSGGFGDMRSPIFSGGFNFTSNINVTNSGNPITSLDVHRWARQISDEVSWELGRRLPAR